MPQQHPKCGGTLMVRENQKIIAIITDFGEEDFYVGAMKGVILSINPRAIIVDISHYVRKFSIVSGAYVLYGSYNNFPIGTTFLIVVDPGVGSSREPLLVITEKYKFVAPNNGVLSLVLQKEKVKKVYKIPKNIFTERPSFTFHGRDIFAPAAAYASLDNFEVFEEFNGHLVFLDVLKHEIRENYARGHIIHVDSFGNMTTSIPYEKVSRKVPYSSVVTVEGIGRLKVVRFFSELSKGEIGLIPNSIGLIEICRREGSAYEALNLELGDEVTIYW